MTFGRKDKDLEGALVKKLLIVVDYQKDFVDGALGFPKAVELEEGIYNKIKAYKDSSQEVIFTFDTHTEDYITTQEGRKLPLPHCFKGSEGWKLYGRVAELLEEGDKCFEKPAFGSLELGKYLSQSSYSSIELVGLVSNICVISNAIIAKAAIPEAEVVVDAACTASFDEVLNEKTLDVLEGLQIKVINR